MSKLNREEFLHVLESVSPGLSPREVLEQSNCFIFQKGQVFSFNDEVACRRPTGLPEEITGAVPSKPLLEILAKLKEDEIEVLASDGEMIVTGERRSAGIRMEAEILLPLDAIEPPKSWKTLPGDFAEAIKIVSHCAGKDADNFSLTCVHVHPNWLEACDDTQLCRWGMQTLVNAPTLVRSTALRHVSNFGMVQYSETDAWLHFRNESNLVLSVRRYLGGADEFPDLGKAIRGEGTKVQLPKGLVEAAERANVFSSEGGDNNRVMIELRPGKLKIEGRGVSGWYREAKRIKWAEDSVSFLIAPSLLSDLVKRHTEVSIGKGKLIVNGGPYVYVAALGKPEAEEPEESEPTDGDE